MTVVYELDLLPKCSFENQIVGLYPDPSAQTCAVGAGFPVNAAGCEETL